jgi:flagellar hook-associated protein 1 FlgK
MHIGYTALNAARQALNTTSHNIANANTEGYSRQRINQTTNAPTNEGGLYYGNGVKITDVQQLRDRFVEGQVRNLSSEQQRLDAFHTLASRIDGVLAEDDASLTGPMQAFFNSLDQLNNDPDSSTNRQAVLSEAQNLADRFNVLDKQFSGLYLDSSKQIESEVNEVNILSKNIAELNNKINSSPGKSPPNDLLDERNRLIGKLSEHISVNVVEQNNHMVNVYAGNGISLVNNAQATALGVKPNAMQPERLEVSLGDSEISAQIQGGKLGGIMDFRREMLDGAANNLGRLATTLATTFNEQHQLGIDKNGAPGGIFFKQGEPRVFGDANNQGNAQLTAKITDGKALTDSDYALSFDGNQYTLTRLTDNQSQTAALPLTMDGIEFNVTGASAAGDHFLIRPTVNGAKNISLALANTNQIAAASPLRSLSTVSNAGDAVISTPQIVDRNDPNLSTPAEIRFTSDTTYDLGDGIEHPYIAGENIERQGWRINIEGTPKSGDRFRIEANTNGSGDNSNGLLLNRLQFGENIEGRTTFQDAYGALINEVGSTTRRIEVNRDSQDTLLAQAEAARDSVSGVNLDEEAVNLTKFQQAYQASAQIISTSKSLFDTILSVIR